MAEHTFRIISRQPGAAVFEVEEGFVVKAGRRVRPAEPLAMELLLKHTKVPVPELINSIFRPGHGHILMSLVPGDCLRDVWHGLDAEDKTSICIQIWKFVEEWRCIPKPLELQHLYACSVEGKFGDSPLITNGAWSVLEMEKDSDILSDKALRERICENYYNCFGRKYTKDQLFDMLPISDKPPVFAHGDLRPKNIMVSGSQVTGIIDWESAGWYPEYWEHVGLSSPTNMDGDWTAFMTACAPQTWDLRGIDAASKVLK